VERGPAWQQHDFDRHHRRGAPRHDAVKRQQRARKDIAAHRATAREDGLAGAPHVLRVGRVADHFQREIRLHAGADVEIAVMEKRPAAMCALDAAQIGGNLCLKLRVDGLAEIVPEQHIFGWNRGIGFEFEDPVPIPALPVQQRFGRRVDVLVKRVRGPLVGPRR